MDWAVLRLWQYVHKQTRFSDIVFIAVVNLWLASIVCAQVKKRRSTPLTDAHHIYLCKNYIQHSCCYIQTDLIWFI